ncbi:MAG TPA: hypothetical protein ENI48_02530 [Thioploca sp.]|nr:hypothetical protein [Thioploca sp.]
MKGTWCENNIRNRSIVIAKTWCIKTYLRKLFAAMSPVSYQLGERFALPKGYTAQVAFFESDNTPLNPRIKGDL